VFYICHHPLAFIKGEKFIDYWSMQIGVGKKSSAWRLFVGPLFKLFVEKFKHTPVISFMKC
jgi:hypothetical protein